MLIREGASAAPSFLFCYFFAFFGAKITKKRRFLLFLALFFEKITKWRCSFKNVACAIVCRFLGQQLHKKADLCNCWPFFKQTVAHVAACIIVHHFSGQQLYKNVDLYNCRAFFGQTITEETKIRA